MPSLVEQNHVPVCSISCPVPSNVTFKAITHDQNVFLLFYQTTSIYCTLSPGLYTVFSDLVYHRTPIYCILSSGQSMNTLFTVFSHLVYQRTTMYIGILSFDLSKSTYLLNCLIWSINEHLFTVYSYLVYQIQLNAA